jgi:hypothetical protein
MSVIVSDSQVRGFNPSVVGGVGTGVFVFPSILGTSFNNGGNSLANAAQAVAPAVVTLRNPSGEGQIFTIKAAGSVYVDAGDVTLYLYQGDSLTSTDNILISHGAATAESGYVPFAYQVSLQGDSRSGLVQIVSASLILGGASISLTEGEASPPSESGVPLSGVNLLTTSLPFCVAAQFSESETTNAAYLQQFVLEQ